MEKIIFTFEILSGSFVNGHNKGLECLKAATATTQLLFSYISGDTELHIQ